MWVGLLGIGPSRLGPLTPDAYMAATSLESAPGYAEAFWWARYAVALASAGLLTVSVGLAWKLLGAGPGLAGGLLLLLDPYVVGMSRLLHVDALLAPLLTVSVLAALVFWTRTRQRRHLALSAGAAGLALLTKAPAAFVVVYVSILALATARPWRRGCREWRGMLPLVGWGAIVAATYALLWPALWRDPIGDLRRVAQFALSTGLQPHEAPNFFMGSPISEDPGLLYYPVALGLRLSPIALAGLVALPVVLGRRRGPVVPLLWLLVWAGLFVALMTVGAKKFDRYILPAIWTIDLLAGAALWIAAGWLRRPLALATLAALLLVQVGLLWRAYPYPIAFYNPLLGGVETARATILVGWGEGLDQAVAYLNGLSNAHRLLVATNYNHAVRPSFLGSTAAMRPYQRNRPSGHPPPSPNYYMLYINSVQRHSMPPEVRPLAAGDRPAFVATVNGVPYVWVYRVPWVPDYVEGPPSVPAGSEEGEGDE
jgi:4-amino-4-deoxy-L-arabinose transferase-like glycosyltransferase